MDKMQNISKKRLFRLKKRVSPYRKRILKFSSKTSFVSSSLASKELVQQGTQTTTQDKTGSSYDDHINTV